MAKTLGNIAVVKNGNCYDIHFELPEKLYPYLLHAMRFNNPEAFEESLKQVQEGKIESGTIISSGTSYFIQKAAIKWWQLFFFTR